MCLTKVICNERSVNVFDLILQTNLIALLCLTIYIKFKGYSFFVEPGPRKAVIARSVVGLTAYATLTLSAALCSITAFISVGNMAPFFASLFAYMFLGEALPAFQIIGMFVGFGGVILVAIALGQ